MRRSSIVFLWLALSFLAALLVGCGPRDPRAAVLEQRAAWDVELLSTVIREDGSALAQFRLSGPVNRKLDRLTVRIDLLDGEGAVLRSDWHVFDLTDIERGVPTEKLVALPATDPAPEGITFDTVLAPTVEQEARIAELDGVGRD